MSSRIDELEKEVDRLVVQVLVFSGVDGSEERCRRAGEEAERRGAKGFKFACFLKTRKGQHDGVNGLL